MYQQHMLLKLRKPISKYTLNKYNVHWVSSFKHLKLPISTKIPITIWQIVYIIDKFDYTSYAEYLKITKIYENFLNTKMFCNKTILGRYFTSYLHLPKVLSGHLNITMYLSY